MSNATEEMKKKVSWYEQDTLAEIQTNQWLWSFQMYAVRARRNDAAEIIPLSMIINVTAFAEVLGEIIRNIVKDGTT